MKSGAKPDENGERLVPICRCLWQLLKFVVVPVAHLLTAEGPEYGQVPAESVRILSTGGLFFFFDLCFIFSRRRVDVEVKLAILGVTR